MLRFLSRTIRTAVLPTLVTIFALGANGALADATTTTGTMIVNATVINACLLTVGPMAFGNYNGTAASATAVMTTTCTSGGTPVLSADAGQNAGTAANFAGRAMKSGTTLLPYQVYTTAAATTVWGDGTGGSATIPVTPGVATLTNVYGKIAGGLYTVGSGVYTDNVTVTLTY